jgi:hypothetical protein
VISPLRKRLTTKSIAILSAAVKQLMKEFSKDTTKKEITGRARNESARIHLAEGSLADTMMRSIAPPAPA